MSPNIGTRPCSGAEIPGVEVWDWQEEGLLLVGREQADAEHQEVERLKWDVDERIFYRMSAFEGEFMIHCKTSLGRRELHKLWY